ncbi:acyl-CoA dehydrogenase family protein [Sinosporangium siamense]|uniref:Acyl-CoA dehydrogenase n=1 Tax=Sinosporangium siamense TaxID=1367973 RepID=A0A919RIF4_9ACTN|nr:acyl-CoA dehydrogenase family protein [Sinosporangium siamense]GII94465.1 acyl-CoA dehydrogenase [Sinosporangium siamense]
MSEIIAALVATVREASAKQCDIGAVTACADGGWNAELWTALEQIGVTMLSVPEEHGGAGGDVAAAVAVLEVLGEYSAGVPLAETALLAGWLIAGCGATVPSGPMTAAVASPELRTRQEDTGLSVRGTVARVPWARYAHHVAVLDNGRVILLGRSDFLLEQGTNLAGEPRDDLAINAIVPASRVHEPSADSAISVQAFYGRAALARAALMAGAARRALELAVAYAGEREQFGRPIAKFQAVQQHLAAMAGEVLLSKMAVEAAALALDTQGDADVAVAAAKLVAGQMAGVVASLAHQIHGAIGFTEEHPLRHSTTRLWAWRDESGNEDEWSGVLGQRVVSEGTGGLWSLLTGAR